MLHRKKTDNTDMRQKVDNTEKSQILEYLVHTAGITGMPDGAVVILDVDPKELLGVMITGGVMRTAVIVYRIGDFFNLYNSTLKLTSGMKILKKDICGSYELETFGREVRPKSGGGWSSSEFFNDLFITFNALQKKVEEKFDGAKTIYYKKL